MILLTRLEVVKINFDENKAVKSSKKIEEKIKYASLKKC